ncbi:MAG: OmpA family protein [Bacteroidota bacterium]
MSKTGLDFERAAKTWVVPNEASTDLISPRLQSRNLNACQAHSGKNMAGIVINGDFWSEYVGIKLKAPLVPGQKYYIEYWISMPSFYSRRKPVAKALNDYFGLRFDRKRYHFDKRILNGKPQVPAGTSTFVEPEKWTKVSGTFVADSSHTHLYVGQFWESGQTEELAIGYFFLDDIYVEAFESKAVDYEPSRYYKIENGVASVIMDNIYFETDRYELKEESYNELKKLVRILEKNPGLQLNIQGHTDAEGGQSHNLTLSANRAKTVYEYLVEGGINPNRLTSKGYGFSKPIADNETDLGRQKNRRVDFVASGALSNRQAALGPEYVYRFSEDLSPDDRLSRAFNGYYSKEWNCPPPPAEVTPSQSRQFQACQATDAQEIVLAQSKNKRAVFFNESAANPQGRAFLHSLLQSYYDEGFKYLCLQALGHQDKDLANRAYPVLNTGIATKEATYGQLIRSALQMGFELVAFEPQKEEMEKALNILKRQGQIGDANSATALEQARQWARAMNLIRLFKKDSAAKLLVLVNDDSIRETTQADGSPSMAQRFQQFSNTNPFTIDQRTLSEACAESQHPLYAKLNIQQPSVLSQRNKTFVLGQDTDAAPYDLQVAHPPTKLHQGRPNWLATYLDRNPYPFNPNKHGLSYPCLVLAYAQGEDVQHAVPVDVIEMKNADERKSLFLPTGNYTLILKDKGQQKKLQIQIQ